MDRRIGNKDWDMMRLKKFITIIKCQLSPLGLFEARIKFLEDKDEGGAEPSGEDATIKGRSLQTGEEAGVERSTERGSNDTEELINVLTSLDAGNILTSRVQVVSVSPAAEVSTVGIPTGSGLVPTASPIFTTASVVTPYSRRKGKEKMIESDTPKKKKLQEQIDVQMMIDGLDRNNEMIAKHLHEYEQAAADKPLSKKQQREFYMSVLKSHSGWKTKHFKGMSLEEIREKFIPFWKQIKDFVPMASKEEGERFKRKGLRLEQESPKKMKTSEEVSQEDLTEMMQLVPVEERNYWKIIRLGGSTAVYQYFVDMLKHFDREDLIQLWTLVKETLSIRQATNVKYTIELADGKPIGTDMILRGCTLNILNHPFNIELMPVELGCFDIIIGMDWLTKYHSVIICDEKLVHVPFGNNTLTIQEDRSEDRSESRVRDEDILKTTFRTRYGYYEFQVMHFGLTNVSTIFMVLMNQVCKPYLDKFVIVFIDNILMYSPSKEEHEEHLKLILELLKKEECIHIDPVNIELIKDWIKTLKKIRQFLGLADYYRRFIEGFSKIAKPLTKLTQKNVMFEWEEEESVELKRLSEPDVEDQLWTHTQALMHDPVE
nr:putative reverse transcriptase domain-containing protein [Tanacetum cinerariifolium]